MTFNEYFEKIQRQISRASSLEDLLVWRKRINIGIAGLPYKANKGCLVAHCYTSNKEVSKRNNQYDNLDHTRRGDSMC